MWLLATAAAFSHGPWLGPGADNIARALLGILHTNQSFSATATGRMTSPHPDESLTWTISIAYFEGKLRTELDTAQIGGTLARDPEEVARNKAMGVSRIVFIFDPEKPRTYIYPDLNIYAEETSALSDHDNPDVVASNRNVMVSGPHRLEFSTSDGECFIELHDVVLDPPDAALFAPPENSRKFSSILDAVRAAGQAYYDTQAPH